MSRECEISGSKTAFGGNHKHKRGRAGGGGVWRFKAPNTKRTWKPNLRKVKVVIDGVPKRIKISMKAYKKLKTMQENA